MGSSQRRTAYFAALGLTSVLMLPIATTQAGLFSCFAKREQCQNCSGTQDVCESCRCHGTKCEKRLPFWKHKFCGEDAPVAPVGQSLGAMNVNQIAIPVAPTQLAVPVSHTQLVTTPPAIATQTSATTQNNAQLTELRDMLIKTNEAILQARQAAAQQGVAQPTAPQQTATQQAASSTDAAKVEELKAELEELKQQIQLLSKALVQMKK